jgi:hypothetical protein
MRTVHRLLIYLNLHSYRIQEKSNITNKCYSYSQLLLKVCVAHLVSFLCSPVMCPYVLCSVLLCPLRFPHKNDVWFALASSCLQEDSCLIVFFVYVCAEWCPTFRCCSSFLFSALYFWFCLSSSCVLCTQCWQFLWIVHTLLPLRLSLTFILRDICLYCPRPI